MAWYLDHKVFLLGLAVHGIKKHNVVVCTTGYSTDARGCLLAVVWK
jgi:hypothetical protein